MCKQSGARTVPDALNHLRIKNSTFLLHGSEYRHVSILPKLLHKVTRVSLLQLPNSFVYSYHSTNDLGMLRQMNRQSKHHNCATQHPPDYCTFHMTCQSTCSGGPRQSTWMLRLANSQPPLHKIAIPVLISEYTRTMTLLLGLRMIPRYIVKMFVLPNRVVVVKKDDLGRES